MVGEGAQPDSPLLDQRKIYANLIFRGHLDADGLVVEQALPAPGEEPALTGDFDPLRQTLF